MPIPPVAWVLRYRSDMTNTWIRRIAANQTGVSQSQIFESAAVCFFIAVLWEIYRELLPAENRDVVYTGLIYSVGMRLTFCVRLVWSGRLVSN